MSSARTVIGIPVLGTLHLGQALESLLGQKSDEFAIVVVDDSMSSATAALVAGIGRDDPRIHYEPNPRRLGLIECWRRCVAVARAMHPGARYFAWGSDHDLWERRWLASVTTALDEHPTAVLAYPLNDRISDAGAVIDAPWRFSTAGEARSVIRFAKTLRRMVAGDMVYGLYRVEALERCGVFRRVLMPDRLLLAELALEGEFVQVEDLLWHRRAELRDRFDRARQRDALFAGRPPATAHAPWWAQHASALAAAGKPAAAAAYIALAPGLSLARRAYYALGGKPRSSASSPDAGRDSSERQGPAARSSSTE